MNILLLCNTFKGTLSNVEVNDVLEKEIRKIHPHLQVLSYPFSDGGNNMLESYLKLYPESEVIQKRVHGPDRNQEVDSSYLIHDGVAYIESAKASGILLSKDKNPFFATSYGVGQLLLDALNHQVREIRIGLGGSATNDGGAGMLKALGVIFYGAKHHSFLPLGITLDRIESIDPTNIDLRFRKTKITILSDVNNPLIGKDGASRVFSKQKGCQPRYIYKLERAMKAYKNVVVSTFHEDKSMLPSAGAAGGMGYALMQFLHGEVRSGADSFLAEEKIRDAINKADLIITGEGHLDQQTFEGKGISRILVSSKKAGNKTIIAIAGKVDSGIEEYSQEKGIEKIYVLNNKIRHRTMDEKKRLTTESLKKAMHHIMMDYPDFFRE